MSFFDKADLSRNRNFASLERSNSTEFSPYTPISNPYIGTPAATKSCVCFFHFIHPYKLCENCSAPREQFVKRNLTTGKPIMIALFSGNMKRSPNRRPFSIPITSRTLKGVSHSR